MLVKHYYDKIDVRVGVAEECLFEELPFDGEMKKYADASIKNENNDCVDFELSWWDKIVLWIKGEKQ